jgi:hypothetical protein
MSYEIRIDDTGRAVSDLGVIEHPWPVPAEASGSVVAEIGPMILLDGITMIGLEMWEWLYESGGFDLQLTKSDDDAQSFLHIHASNGRWTYELHPAHWAEGAAIDDRDLGVYLGVWPD